MSWALGEIKSLSVKAARGAGMDWGIAEEAGFAAEWLEAHGLQGTKALAQYLSKVHRQDDFNYHHCPLLLGSLISDSNDWRELEGKSIHEPMLIIPFIANVLDNEALRLSWNNHNIIIQKNGITTANPETLASRRDAKEFLVEAQGCQPSNEILETKTRVLGYAEPHIAILNALAHKTYAPATEASRLAGAGAGLSDND